MWKFLKWLMEGTAALTILLKGISWYDNSYMVNPIIKCQNNEDSIECKMEGDYRAATLRVRPQLVLRYEDKVILLVYLKDYYDNEYLQFDSEGTCVFSKSNEEYVGNLQRYLKEKIVSAIQREFVANSEEKLFVYMSNIGGVRYVNSRGNIEKRYCFIEENGIVIVYNIDDTVIKDRLYETELKDEGKLNNLEEEDEIQMIVQTVSK